MYNTYDIILDDQISVGKNERRFTCNVNLKTSSTSATSSRVNKTHVLSTELRRPVHATCIRPI